MKFINEKIASRTSIHTAGTDPVARPPQGILTRLQVFSKITLACSIFQTR